MFNLLLTGGNGFIGSNIILELLKKKYVLKIIVVDNLSNSSIKNLLNLKKKCNEKLIFYKYNIANKEELKRIIQFHNINAVIHLASLKSIPQSEKFPGLYYYNNVIGSKVVFELIKEFKIKDLILSSSATVYGNPLYLPIDETHPTRAINNYAKNKIDIENLLHKDEYFKNECSVKVLRYFNPVGADVSGVFGDPIKSDSTNLMPIILKAARKKIPYVGIFGKDYPTDDGTPIRDYIHITDLALGHIRALEYKAKGISVFNIGTGIGYSVLDMILTFESINKVKVDYKFLSRRKGDSAISFANCDKAKSLLNFEADKTLSMMCKDSWNCKSNI